jgi:uncharacterized protein YndB with AHSA1/START domain
MEMTNMKTNDVILSETQTESWDIEREIVICRVISAPRALVFEAWTQERHLIRWFGPNGFVNKSYDFDFRVGGHWRFDMHAPDGTVYPNSIEFTAIQPVQRLEFAHGSKPNDPGMFRVIVTFDEQSDGKTVVTLRQQHPSREQRATSIGFGAVELGLQTLDKLGAVAAELAKL